MKVNNAKKAVIICASPESSFYSRTLKLIIEKNDFDECIIICAADITVLDSTSITLQEKENSYGKLKNDTNDWMNVQNKAVVR